ncbi:MAG: FKBP-type peptidyl-prolyl cis-trans isomerase, partial [Candidatus Thiodiazotropha weberae]|nr:FKBP-type peptidyl-prolyl cis-trans isomerase [Candidatus Thiodiazotropha lotti]MCW4212005.1 FKBP-type peptidyl-prolyl cis-trans isomerase [Candidatus Thiodiazotropha lotti]
MSEKITDSGLKIEDLVEGDGQLAESGQRVSVHYTG